MLFRHLFLLLSFIIVTLSLLAQDPNERTQLSAAQFPFFHGVASGDPLSDEVILWTRVTPSDGEMDSIEVFWQIATDIDFTTVVNFGTEIALSENDFTIKFSACGLEPATRYYYIFNALGANSITGMTKTAPATTSDPLKFAVVSCSRYTNGYFNVYEDIALEHPDVDAIIHLGDYIYENGGAGTGGSVGGRTHDPDYEIINTEDYRIRHSQHKLDYQAQRMHQLMPMIATWDDHESTNNSYRDGAENHDTETEGDWGQRKIMSAQAYKEWMPIRNPDPNDDLKIWRNLSYGDLVNLVILDTRLWGRDEPDLNEADNPDHEILGEDQFQWLESQLSDNNHHWNLICQQVMMAPLGVSVPLLGDFGFNKDQWDGYATERERLINYVEGNNLDNNVVLTGDIHTFWANDIPGISQDNALVEFVVSSVTTANSDVVLNQMGEVLGGFLGTSSEEAIKFFNPHIQYSNLSDHGYIILNLDSSRVQADFYQVGVLDLDYDRTHLTSWKVEDGGFSLQEVNDPIAASPIPAIPDTIANQDIEVPMLSDEIAFFTMQNVSLSDCIAHNVISSCLSYTLSLDDGPTSGNIMLTDFCIDYTPPTDFVGIDNAIITVCQNGACFDMLVNFYVYGTDLNGIEIVELDANENTVVDDCFTFDDLIGDVEMITINYSGENGSPSLTVDNCLNYISNVDFIGLDSFYVIGCDASGYCDSILYIINVNESTPIEDISDFAIISAYPNPVEDELILQSYQFQANDLAVFIFDATGKTVLNERIRMDAGLQYLRVYMNDFPKGYYFLEIRAEHSNYRKKILKL